MTTSCSTTSAGSAARGPARLGALLAGLIIGATGCGTSEPPPLTLLEGPSMGTRYTLKLAGHPQDLDEESVQRDVGDLLEAVEASMSTYRADSEITRFNEYPATDWFAVSGEFVDVVRSALEIAELSGGAFDLTVAPLVELWGFGATRRQQLPPPLAEIEAARARVGYRLLEARQAPPALRKSRADLRIDLSAIAKGYAVDKVAAYLEQRGLHHYLVEIGGELRARGHNEHGIPWRIGIEKPRAVEPGVQRVIVPRGRGVATSGDYRNFVTVEGKRYSHALDPLTGWPVSHDLASVTVLGDSVMQADAMATAILVLGPDRGLALAGRLRLPAYLIFRTGAGFGETYTPEFAAFLESASE